MWIYLYFFNLRARSHTHTQKLWCVDFFICFLANVFKNINWKLPNWSILPIIRSSRIVFINITLKIDLFRYSVREFTLWQVKISTFRYRKVWRNVHIGLVNYPAGTIRKTTNFTENPKWLITKWLLRNAS